MDIDNSPEGSVMKRTADLVSRSSLGILIIVMALLAVACTSTAEPEVDSTFLPTHTSASTTPIPTPKATAMPTSVPMPTFRPTATPTTSPWATPAPTLTPIDHHLNLAQELLLEQRRPEAAILELNEASRLDPLDARPYAGRAMAYAFLGNYRDAVREVDRAVELGAERGPLVGAVNEIMIKKGAAADHQITAAELYAEYLSDPAAADEKYLNKIGILIMMDCLRETKLGVSYDLKC